MKKTSLFNFSFVLFCLVFHSGVHAEKLNTTSAGKPVELETLIEKQGVIWGFEFLANDQIIFSEREGSLKIFNLKNKKVILVEGTPEYVSFGQGGLMDIHLDPNFKKNKKLYLTYAVKVGENHTTRVSSAVLNENKLTELKQIFQATPGTKNTVHFGSRLQIDDKGFLFISIGDRGERNLAQDLNTHLGKILRIRTDGTIPEDNPFYGKKDHKPEIWSYGHRNPQGLFFDKETKILWAQEHGPRGGDEINIIEKGKNYGWPKATYGKEYWGPKIGKTHVEGTVQPVYQFTPSIAPGGLLIYKGDHFPKWKNSIFSAALAIPQLNRLYKVGSDYREESLLTELAKRMRHVKEDAQGYIYISTDSGEIYRLK